MGMSSTVNVKQKIMLSLDSLPPEGLQEVVNFLEYMRFKFQSMSKKSTQYKPIALGGLWKGETIDEEDIREVRNEIFFMGTVEFAFSKKIWTLLQANTK